MIHVVTGENQHLYGQQLEEMFRLRHQYFIEENGWEALKSVDGKETDQFDDGDVAYLLNLDEDGHLIASYRLNPTTGPNLLNDCLSHYVDGQPPRDETIWDVTRWMLARGYRRQNGREQALRRSRELIIGLEEFAVHRGITHLTMICETHFITNMSRMQWNLKPLGPVIEFDGGKGKAQAIIVDVGRQSLARTRKALSIYDNLLFEIQSQQLVLSPDTWGYDEQQMTISRKMRQTGRANAQKIVQDIASEIAIRADKDPVSAITLIHEFNKVLAARLDHQIEENSAELNVETLEPARKAS